MSVNWHSIVKQSFGGVGCGRFAENYTQYKVAMGPLWKSSALKGVVPGNG